MEDNKQKTVKELEQEANYAAVEGRNKITPGAKLPDKLADGEIHVMPGKFLPSGTPKKKSTATKQRQPGKNRGILIVIIVGVIFMGAVGFGLWYIVQTSAPTPPIQNTNQNINQIENQNTNLNTNVNQNENINENANINTNVNTPPINDNTNETPSLSVVDTDSDGLTAEEELLFKTNIERADTDLDGFNDGVEIANMFDPLVPGGTLIQSGRIAEYLDSSRQFRFYRPVSWLAQDLDSEQVAILPDSETGEIFSIVALVNEQNASLDELKDLFGTAQSYENYSLDGYPALISTDGREVISILGNYIFVITYDLGNSSVPSYSATFLMILKSFDFFGA